MSIAAAIEREARGRRAIGRILRPTDQPLRVVGGVEEPAVAVAEVRDGDVDQVLGRVQPASLTGDLVKREQTLGDVAVVLEHPAGSPTTPSRDTRRSRPSTR